MDLSWGQNPRGNQAELAGKYDMRESPDQRQPEFRHLRIYAIDPMVSRAARAPMIATFWRHSASMLGQPVPQRCLRAGR